MDLSDCGFATADGARAGEGVAARLDLAATSDGVRATGRVTGGQILWGTVFADASGTRLDLAAELQRGQGPDPWRGHARVAVRHNPTISAIGIGLQHVAVEIALVAFEVEGLAPQVRQVHPQEQGLHGNLSLDEQRFVGLQPVGGTLGEAHAAFDAAIELGLE